MYVCMCVHVPSVMKLLSVTTVQCVVYLLMYSRIVKARKHGSWLGGGEM